MPNTQQQPAGGLGWKPGKGTNPDAYPLAKLLAAKPAPTVQVQEWYADGWWGDQGETSMCTIYAWLHSIADGPILHPHVAEPVYQPVQLYQQGQQIDHTPISETDSGLSSDAAAQVMKQRKLITAYHWAANADEIVQALLTLGPVVFGMVWKTGMDAPDAKGHVKYSGRVRGGHQIVLDGVDLTTGLVRLKNSWGRSWGANGFAYFPVTSLAKMLHDGAEACVAAEAVFDGPRPKTPAADAVISRGPDAAVIARLTRA